MDEEGEEVAPAFTQGQLPWQSTGVLTAPGRDAAALSSHPQHKIGDIVIFFCFIWGWIFGLGVISQGVGVGVSPGELQTLQNTTGLERALNSCSDSPNPSFIQGSIFLITGAIKQVAPSVC